MEYDLKITGGLIIDGSGGPSSRGEVGVKDGRIAALGDVRGGAEHVIDAGGLVVAPGFVDIHTHYDAQIFWDRMLSVSPWHGVTTVVFGNCGFGIAPTRPEHRGIILRTLERVEGMNLAALESGIGYEWPFETFPQYMDAVEHRRAAVNFGVLAGHTPIRLYVMGEGAYERPATEAEIATMARLVHEALECGAVGFSTSKSRSHLGHMGRPVPSRLAEWEELSALTNTLGDVGRGIVVVSSGPGLEMEEYIRISRTNGQRLTFPIMTGVPGHSHLDQLNAARDLIRQGLPLVPQVTSRPFGMEFTFENPIPFSNVPLFKPVAEGTIEERRRIYADSKFRDALKAEVARGNGGPFVGRWKFNKTFITWYPAQPELEERTVADVASERQMDPVDLALDLALRSELKARFRVEVLNDDEDEVLDLLNEPSAVLGISDAGAHNAQLCDACAYTYMLGRWVREKGALSLEQAVRMVSARPAEVFGIKDRGRIAVGLAADITIFDPNTVTAGRLRRVNDMPSGADRLVSDGIGIEKVIVNGTLVRDHGRDVVNPEGPLPGKLLRSGAAVR
jgi:N-acyl-D-amino-acid deacylase